MACLSLRALEPDTREQFVWIWVMSRKSLNASDATLGGVGVANTKPRLGRSRLMNTIDGCRAQGNQPLEAEPGKCKVQYAFSV